MSQRNIIIAAVVLVILVVLFVVMRGGDEVGEIDADAPVVVEEPAETAPAAPAN